MILSALSHLNQGSYTKVFSRINESVVEQFWGSNEHCVSDNQKIWHHLFKAVLYLFLLLLTPVHKGNTVFIIYGFLSQYPGSIIIVVVVAAAIVLFHLIFLSQHLRFHYCNYFILSFAPSYYCNFLSQNSGSIHIILLGFCIS